MPSGENPNPLETVTPSSTFSTDRSGARRYSAPAPGVWSYAIDPAQKLPAGSAAPSFIRMPGSSHTSGSRRSTSIASSSRTNPRWSASTIPPSRRGRKQAATVPTWVRRTSSVPASSRMSPACMSTHRTPSNDGCHTGPSPCSATAGVTGRAVRTGTPGGRFASGVFGNVSTPLSTRRVAAPRSDPALGPAEEEGEACDDHDDPDHQPQGGAGHETAADQVETLQGPQPADEHQHHTDNPTDPLTHGPIVGSSGLLLLGAFAALALVHRGHPGDGDRVAVLQQLGRQLLGIRQRRRPRVAVAEQPRRRRDGEVGGRDVREVVPRDRERHGQPRADPRAVGRDDGGADRARGV